MSEDFNDDENNYEYEMDCKYCGGDHSDFLCSQVTRFDDLDCFKCGETFFPSSGHCTSCGFEQY